MPEETIQYRLMSEAGEPVLVTEKYNYHASPIQRPRPIKQACAQCENLLRWILYWPSSRNEETLGHRLLNENNPPDCVVCWIAWSWYCKWRGACGLTQQENDVEIQLFWRPKSDLLYLRIGALYAEIARLDRWGEGQPRVNQCAGLDLRPHLDYVGVASWLNNLPYHVSRTMSLSQTGTSLSSGFRLIDCQQVCLVQRYQHTDYLALSYVWGQQQPEWLVTTKSNLLYLSRPGVLDCADILNKRVP